jgi:c-di-GMP-binding flagellar brake protein YcgR
VEPVELIRELVYLRIGTQTGLIARIVQLEQNWLVLTQPIDEQGVHVTPAAGAPLEVGWVTREGVEWRPAVVADEQVDDALLRVRLIEAQTPTVERRAFPRASVTLDCEISLFGGEPVRGRIVNVGGGGIAAVVPLQVRPGDSVLLSVLIPGEEPIQLTASCVRTEPQGPAGFVYGLFSAGSRDKLVELAFRRAAQAA